MSEKNEYKIGDVVKLKSYGPDMTVIGINDKDANYVEVSWYVSQSNEFKWQTFDFRALKLVKE